MSRTSISFNTTEYHHIKFVAHSNTIYAYLDDVLKATWTNITWLNSACHIAIGSWTSATEYYFKDLKIKPYSSE